MSTEQSMIIREVNAAVAGDVAAVARLAPSSVASLNAAAEGLDPAVVTLRAVLCVLRSLRSGQVSRAAAQMWALFMQYGALEQTETVPIPTTLKDDDEVTTWLVTLMQNRPQQTPIRPFTIEFEQRYEDAIADALGLLAEDEESDTDALDAMIAWLHRQAC